jgi:hypothetical protein
MPNDEKVLVINEEAALRRSIEFSDSAIPERIELDPDKIENGLARLVLSIVELVRKLLERQALRRMDRGALDDEEVERIGLALMKLEEKMDELKEAFDLTDDDLNLSLGPIHTIE